MTIEKINKYFNDNFVWNFTDLFYAFCENKGIQDPETELTDEEYSALERECCDKISREYLRALVESCSQHINEVIRDTVN